MNVPSHLDYNRKGLVVPDSRSARERDNSWVQSRHAACVQSGLKTGGRRDGASSLWPLSPRRKLATHAAFVAKELGDKSLWNAW